MNNLKSALLALVVSFVSSAALAAAADPRVSTVVAPVLGNEQVTLSRLAGTGKQSLALALDTYAAYQVTITNSTTNTLNRVFLTGAASNVGGTDTVQFDSSIPSGLCIVGNAPNEVKCSLASIPPGTVSPPLIVVFRAPINGSQIRFDWTAGGYEGNGGGNGCCNQTDFASTTLVDPTTDPTFKTQAKTFVRPTAGGTVFTGNEAITNSDDGWSTIVKVPGGFVSPLGTYTLAKIRELSSISDQGEVLSCPSYTLQSECFASELTIPGAFASLEITLRWDKAFFNLGKIMPADVPLKYTGSTPLPTGFVAPPGWTGNYPWKLLLCTATTPAGPSPGIPCLDGPPKILKNTDTPVKDLWGDLEFKVKALDNGKYFPS